jgi:hypothetical protein
MLGNSWVAAQLAASLEGLSSMKLVIHFCKIRLFVSDKVENFELHMKVSVLLDLHVENQFLPNSSGKIPSSIPKISEKYICGILNMKFKETWHFIMCYTLREKNWQFYMNFVYTNNFIGL